MRKFNNFAFIINFYCIIMRKSILYPVLIIVSTLLISCEKEVDPALLPVVSTTKVSSISYYSAQSGGLITGDGGYVVTARGACWSTSPNPDINGSKTVDAAGTGTFESSIDSLIPGTTYYLRAYATNKKGTSYGLQETFTTMPLSLSEVTTSPVTSITTTSAVTGGTISIDGGTPITARGVCWSTSPNPTLNDSITVDGSGSGNFITTLTGLKTGTLYYIKAYATNSNGTAYGNEREFRTQSSIPEVITAAINSITSYTAISGGEISHDGGETVMARGVCWSTSPNPTVNNSKTVNGNGKGSYTSTLSNLKSGTQYYVRAYATNSRGTAYGNEHIFNSSIGLPELSTIEISEMSTSTAKSGGIITHDGGAEITSRGVVWSTTQDPTIDLSTKTSDGSGTGLFTSSITGLSAVTTYYVRAYATNSAGTAYGNQVSFRTRSVLTTSTITSPTGKVWMDRNLGASRVATSSTDDQAYGDLYQWGRGTDGHEKRSSQTTSSLSSSDTPGHGNFITVSSGNYDWRSPQNNNLWQGENGINNPCPEGFRVPTAAEWEAERAYWSSYSSAGAFASPLKLPVAGSRNYSSGWLKLDSFGFYWSVTVSGKDTQSLLFDGGNAYMYYNRRAYGFSVRCIKDY
ncbi:MAG: FISUMP domain-containing protein [Paludibacter sp.]|nr:FISUMP domain-containing protein [Paludibacter sp.]